MTNTQAYNAASVAAILPAQPRAKKSSHVRIEHDFIENWLPIVGAHAFTVYVALLKRRGTHETAFPSHECIAADTKLSVSSVKRALKTLREHGLCAWSKRTETTKRGHQRQTSNAYFLARCDLPSPSTLSDTPRSNRPTKQDKRRNQVKTETTPLRAETVVADSISSNEPAPTPDTNALIARIVDEAKLSAVTAAKLIEQHGMEKVALQLNWLPARNPKSAPATFRSALAQNWTSPHRTPRAPVAQEPVRANAGAYDEHRPTAPVKHQEPPQAPPKKEVAAWRDEACDAVPEAPRPDAACDVVFEALPDDVQDPVIEDAMRRAPGDGSAARRQRMEIKRAFVWAHFRPQVELLGMQKGEVMQ